MGCDHQQAAGVFQAPRRGTDKYLFIPYLLSGDRNDTMTNDRSFRVTDSQRETYDFYACIFPGFIIKKSLLYICLLI